MSDKNLQSRYDYVKSFANIGDFIEYLGVRMLVVGYNEFIHHTVKPLPALQVEWMDTQANLQHAIIQDYKLAFCKNITKKENISFNTAGCFDTSCLHYKNHRGCKLEQCCFKKDG